MAHRKAGGTAKNLTDSNPKYLGVKLFEGQQARPGAVILRQRGTRFFPGENVKMGRDHTLFSVVYGTVAFGGTRKIGFNGKTAAKKIVRVVPT